MHYAWVVLLVGTASVFGALGLARLGYAAVLVPMQSSLGLDNTASGMLASANLTGYLAMCLIGGALASRLGPRVVIAAGLLVAGLGMAFTGLAGGFAPAMVWRAVAGLGSGAANVPVMGLIAAWFGARRRGMAAGIGVTGSSIGLITTGLLVPRVLSAQGEAGWRLCWFVYGGVTVLLALAALVFLRNRPSDLSLVPYGAEPDEESSSAPAAALDWGRVYRSPLLWCLGPVYIAYGFSYMAYMTFFVKALVADGGYTQQQAGNLFVIMGWCSVPCGVIWGALSDVIGRKRALVLLYLVHTVAFSVFALAPSPAGFTLSAVLFGLSAWSIPAVMAAFSGDLLGPRLAPAGLGFITLFLGVGQAVGPGVGGALADAAHSLLPVFLLAAGISFAGATGAALLPARSPQGVPVNVPALEPEG